MTLDINFTDRSDALLMLLRPITWPGGSDVWQRKEIVNQRRRDVHLILPFLTESEKALAEQWLKDEKHEGLWE
jgi:hypothetical protein